MTTISSTDVSRDRHMDTDRAHYRDRSDRGERAGLIGWQRSASSSVLMAAVTAIAVQLVFTALGLAIGATAADVNNSTTADAGNVGMAAGAWWLVTGTISLAVGGLTLGRMSGVPRSADLLLAGLAMWAVTAVFGFFVVWSGMMSAATSPLAAMSAQTVDRGGIIAGRTPAAADTGVIGASIDNPDAGEPSISQSERVRATNDPTTERAENAARTASWWTVIGMLIGAGATMGGAWATAPKATVIVGD